MTEIALPDEQELAEALETDLLQVANLEKNRAWLSLKAHLYTRRRLLKERQVRAIFRKGAEPVDQREVDYTRGMIDAIEWMLTLPERTKRNGDHS
jgi:hypothetical protein